MKIVALTHYYIEENRSGGELMLHNMLRELVKAGHDVTAIITRTIHLNSVIDGVKVVYVANANHILDHYDYDIIISQFENAEIAARHAHKNNKKVCYIVHNDSVRTQWEIKLLNPDDFIVYNTKWIQKKTYSPCRSMVVHPPIDTVPQQHPEPRHYVTLVNLTQPKGVDIFYNLVRNMPEIDFLGVRGGYHKDLQQCHDLPNLTIINNTADMYNDVYKLSKIVLMPSMYESYGMVAAEAMAYGIPVIATPLPGLKENLGDAGIFIPFRDVLTWRDEIRRLRMNPVYYNRKSRQCLIQNQTKKPEAELYTFIQVLEGMV